MKYLTINMTSFWVNRCLLRQGPNKFLKTLFPQQKGAKFVHDESHMVNLDNTLDRWILSFTQSLVLFVEQEMAGEFFLPFICNTGGSIGRNLHCCRQASFLYSLCMLAGKAWFSKRAALKTGSCLNDSGTVQSGGSWKTLLIVVIFFLKHWTFADFFKLRCMPIDNLCWKIKRPLPKKKVVVLHSINCSWIRWTQSIAEQPLNRSF